MKKEEQILLKRVGRMADPVSVEEYIKYGGFEGIRRAIDQDSKEAILAELDTAMILGRGGAAYPLGRKWRHLYGNPRCPKYIVCNADEGEPGTFKDKMLLRKDPFSVIEGMLIAGYVFGSKQGYIYIRGEYRQIQENFQQALDNAKAAGYLGRNILGVADFDYDIAVISGGGAYVCGENSALLNSIEGTIGRPRVKPPHLADIGLYQQPTLVNNVESFACVTAVMNIGGQTFRDIGTPDCGGTKLVCLSGHVKNKGVYEVALGTSLEEILYGEQYGGGTASGRPIEFCHFGGQSGPLGFKGQIEGRSYDYRDLKESGLAVGSGAIVVMDDSADIVEYLKSVMEFFVHESCGKCTPCRLGTVRMLEVLERLTKAQGRWDDLERFNYLLEHVTSLSACGLGQSVSVSMRSGLNNRREAFEACIAG